MPTQAMSPADIERNYGRVAGLVAGAAEQPFAPGLPAGRVTDDTDQAVILAELLLAADGAVSPSLLAQRLEAWERDMLARGEHDLLGPSTKAALARIRQGVPPDQAGRGGVTNGAAMRVTPVGIACPPGEGLLGTVAAASAMTHNSAQALGAAAAVAGAVSAGVEGCGLGESLDLAMGLAVQAEQAAPWAAGAGFTARWRAARQRMGAWLPGQGAGKAEASASGDRLTAFLRAEVGTSVLASESVVAALVLAEAFAERPYQGLLLAANLGGDTDTVGAIAGAVWGAHLGPDWLPGRELARIRRVNRLELDALAAGLAALRANTFSD